MDRYEVVKDEGIIHGFLKAIGAEEMNKGETFYICTSFRPKKIDEDKRAKYGKKIRQIYLTKFLKKNDKGEFNMEDSINKLYELEVPKRAQTYYIGTPDEFCLPQSAMVCYIIPNPSKEFDVSISHMESTLEIIKEFVHSPNNNDLGNRLCHHNGDFRSERSKFVNKKWIDFDIDVEYKEENVKEVKSIIKETMHKTKYLKNLKGILVQSSGGFHTLIKNCCLCGNPHFIINELTNNLKQKFVLKGEKPIVFTSNGLCPLPGTLQYGSIIVTYEEF